jgi:hypothetical protein
MAKKKSKRRKTAKSACRHRPVVIKRGKKWYRPKKSKLFPQSTTLAGRKVPESKEKILIKEGFLMASKKRKMSKKQKAALARGRRRAAGKRMRRLTGYAGGKPAHRKKRAHVSHVVTYRGDPGPDFLGVGVDIAGLLAGAIGLSLVASIIPIKNPKFKSLIPIVAGIAGMMFPAVADNRFGSRAALGSFAIGGYTLTKILVPKIPLMGAADTAEGIGQAIENLPPEEKAILGLLPDESQPQAPFDGDPDNQETTEYLGSEPGEMLGNEPGEMLGSEPGEMLGMTETIGENEDFE